MRWQTVRNTWTETQAQTVTHGVIISPTVENESFYWTNSGMFIPVQVTSVEEKKKEQNRHNEYSPDHS